MALSPYSLRPGSLSARFAMAALVAATFGVDTSSLGRPAIRLPYDGTVPIDESEKFGQERLDAAAARRIRREEKRLRNQQRTHSGLKKST